MARSSKDEDEYERRLAAVYPLVACGLSAAVVRVQLAKNSIYVSASTVARYVKICRRRMLAAACVEPDEAHAESLARRHLIFQRAFLGGDRRTALAAQDSIDRMYDDYRCSREHERDEVRRFLDALEGGEPRLASHSPVRSAADQKYPSPLSVQCRMTALLRCRVHHSMPRGPTWGIHYSCGASRAPARCRTPCSITCSTPAWSRGLCSALLNGSASGDCRCFVSSRARSFYG